MLWLRSIMIGVGVLGCVDEVRSADCNGNGVEDSLDIVPGNLEFEAEPVWGRMSGPETLVADDWNADGKVDLATANGSSYNISVFLKRADGDLDEPVHYHLGWSPDSLLSTDLNDDGKPDLVAGTWGGVFVLLGRGDGTFEDAVSCVAGEWVSALLAEDLNGDGKPDLAAGTRSGIFVLVGRGDGTFEDAVSYVAGEWISALLAGDLNGDGKPDLAAGASGVYLLLGHGDGTFDQSAPYGTGGGVGALLAADLNGDGKPDLVAKASSRISVLLSRGDGTLDEAVSYAAGGPIAALVAADLNGDGAPDLAAKVRLCPPEAQCTTRVLMFLGSGDGTFEDAVPYEVGVWDTSVLLATDLTGDAKPEVVVGTDHGHRGSLSVLVGRGDGTFEDVVVYPLRRDSDWTYVPWCVMALDFDSDGRTDLVGVGRNGSELVDFSGVFLLAGRGDGTFDDAVVLWDQDLFFGSLLASDLDGDGKAELVATNLLCNQSSPECASGLHVFGVGDDGAFEEAVLCETVDGFWPPLVSDFNGDGNLDLAAGTWEGVMVLLGRGDGTFKEALSHSTGGGVRTLLATDLNGDGMPDLAAGTGEGVMVLLGRGDGTFEEAVSYAAGNEVSAVLAADLNGDGNPDLVGGAAGGGSCGDSIVVLLGRGDGRFEQALRYEWEEHCPTSLLAADLNGDGKLDLAAGTWEGVMVLLGRGDGTFEDAVEHETGSSRGIVVAADLNGDATPDLVVPGWRGVLVLVGRGDGTFEEVVVDAREEQFYVLLAADFDGDRRKDLAFTTAGGVWVLRNRTPGPASLDRDGNGIPDECQERFRRGDPNDDNSTDLSDAIFVLSYLFLGGTPPDCEDAADADDSGSLEITDAVFLLDHLFLGGPAPAEPFPACGADSTPDDALNCEAFEGCRAD